MALEKDTERLITIYSNAQDKLERAISKIKPKNPYLRTRRDFLGEIVKITESLQRQSEDWSKETVENFYNAGSKSIIKGIVKAGTIARIETSFNLVDKEAIEALLNDVNFTFGETMQAITRSSQKYLNDFRKTQIINEVASDIASGSGIRKAKSAILEQIQSDGFVAFRDRAGRTWSLKRYSELLARTVTLKARNEGAKVRLLKNGARYAKISRHSHEDDICSQYEGKVVDLLDPQIPLPPYHPNCKHVIQYVDPTEIDPNDLVE